MIIKYNTLKYIKEHKIRQTLLARKLKISKQLLYYHIRTGHLSITTINAMAQILKVAPSKVLNDLNNNYIKQKI